MKVGRLKNGPTPERFMEVKTQDYKFKPRNILSEFLKSNKKMYRKSDSTSDSFQLDKKTLRYIVS